MTIREAVLVPRTSSAAGTDGFLIGDSVKTTAK